MTIRTGNIPLYVQMFWLRATATAQADGHHAGGELHDNFYAYIKTIYLLMHILDYLYWIWIKFKAIELVPVVNYSQNTNGNVCMWTYKFLTLMVWIIFIIWLIWLLIMV